MSAIAADARAQSGNTKTDQIIPRAQADALLVKWDELLYRPGQKLAPTERGYGDHPVAIGRNCRLEFGNSLLASVLRAQHCAFGVMRLRISGRCRQGSTDQPFGALAVRSDRVAPSIQHAARKYSRQIALRFDRLRIERQRALELADLLRI